MCERQEQLVGYIYDEIPPVERGEFEAHLLICADCRAELDGLRATRVHLSHWAPPEPDLGFRVIRGGAEPAPALPRRFRFAPAFAFAAAAAIVLAVAAAIANIEVRYGSDGMTVRTGWAGGATEPVRTAETQAPVVTTVSRATEADEFAALERRLQQLELALSEQTTVEEQPASGPRMSDAQLLRQVRQIVAEAQARQESDFALRLLAAYHDLDLKRRADLATLQQGLGQFQGLTNAEIATQRDLLQQFIRTSTRQEK